MQTSDATPLYQKIAEAIREDILYQKLVPGDQLPTIRDLAARWNCTPGTVHRAYRELGRQGLVESHSGRGTSVIQAIQPPTPTPLRQAQLVHRAEAFLLEVLTAGYSPEEVEAAMHLATERWRVLSKKTAPARGLALRFIGSHDPALSIIAPSFGDYSNEYHLEIQYAGSLGGLMALARGEADLAGCHLWDHASDSYNTPFVERLFPGKRLALITLAHRELGLITQPGNPRNIHSLHDLLQPGLRFANRQEGAGTRIWLDHQLALNKIACEAITGYDRVHATHSELARAIAEDEVDVGLGVRAAASSYHLGFVPLTRERYDLVVPENIFANVGGSLQAWLKSDVVASSFQQLGGYILEECGHVRWVG